MVQDLSGFLYGMHLIVARKSLTESLAPDIACETFDNKIHELEGYGSYSLLSLTECGVQTGESLLQRYKVLDKELIARGVKRPVLEMTDNHVSRYDDEVMEFCQSVGIHQWSEESNTSGIFQALDQNNKTCHVAYDREKKELKHNIAIRLSNEEA
eukprot:8360245-Pyramimonas_sp.AAC.1